MALILEVRDPQGVVTRRAIETLPLTIGRALSNDIIVDDPYVEALHVRVDRDAGGAITITDLGSVNGLYAGMRRVAGSEPVAATREFRAGKTILRFRDSSEPVPPALIDAGRPSLAMRRAASSATDAGAVGAMAIAIAMTTWLDNTGSSSGSDVFSSLLAGVVGVFLWSLAWALAVRGPDRKILILGHARVASIAVFGMVVWMATHEWLKFLFPESAFVDTMFLGAFLFFIAGGIAFHLGVPGTISRKLRWRIGWITSVAVMGLFAISTLLDDDSFSDVPDFDGHLKPMPAVLTPMTSVETFLADVKKLKEGADKAAERQ